MEEELHKLQQLKAVLEMYGNNYEYHCSGFVCV